MARKKKPKFISDPFEPITEKRIQIIADAHEEFTHRIGIHLLNPTESEIEKAKDKAIDDQFDTIYCKYSNVISLDTYRLKKAG